MRTIEVTIYKFSELKKDAKQHAVDEHFNALGYCHADNAMKSLTALAEHFNGKLTDWSIDWGSTHSWVKFDMPEDDDENSHDNWHQLTYDKLAELGTYDPVTLKGRGDCKLTGYCMDESAIDGFRAAFCAGEDDLGRLMQAAFRTWHADCISDYEDMMSFDSFSETCDANDYEFTKNGNMA